MKKIICFGDSLLEGSNSKTRFTDYLIDNNTDVINNGISGTTIGEYSIYPVDGSSLLSIYTKDDRIKDADTIILEYGSNDVTAIMCGFTDIDKVMISFVKALDGIRQLNPTANIKFLSVTDDNKILLSYAELQCLYLEEDYFINYNFKFPVSKWADTYKYLIDAISKSVPVIPMVVDKDFMDKFISSDCLHPNEDGHRIIATNISKLI